jgi:hypothetical protein
VNLDPPSRRSPGSHDDWDHLHEPVDGEILPAAVDPPGAGRDDGGGTVIPMLASSWGDLAAMLGLCAAALAALKLAGHGAPFAAAPWAGAVAVLWWLVASGVLVTVRRATPGMLMAGLAFEAAVVPGRVPWVLVTALVLAVTLGLPSAVGRPGWALRAAAGTPVAGVGHDSP